MVRELSWTEFSFHCAENCEDLGSDMIMTNTRLMDEYPRNLQEAKSGRGCLLRVRVNEALCSTNLDIGRMPSYRAVVPEMRHLAAALGSAYTRPQLCDETHCRFTFSMLVDKAVRQTRKVRHQRGSAA
jgi:hypothetical protein